MAEENGRARESKTVLKGEKGGWKGREGWGWGGKGESKAKSGCAPPETKSWLRHCCNSCASSLAGLALCFIACYILLVIIPLITSLTCCNKTIRQPADFIVRYRPTVRP